MDGGGVDRLWGRCRECEYVRTSVGPGQPLGTHWAGWTRAQSPLFFLCHSLSLNPRFSNILLKFEFLLV